LSAGNTGFGLAKAITLLAARSDLPRGTMCHVKRSRHAAFIID
jgi:hypothetical protein